MQIRLSTSTCRIFHVLHNYCILDISVMSSVNKTKLKSKSVSARLYSPKPESDTRESDRSLREQLQLLENENSELRYRLDSLRKAKNQLIIKREKIPSYTSLRSSSHSLPSETRAQSQENILPPGVADQLPPETGDIELRLLELERTWQLRQEEVERNLIREHEEEIQQLQRDNTELRDELEQTRIEKSELVSDFTMKEAKWLEEIQQLESRCLIIREEGNSQEELVEEYKGMIKQLTDKELRIENLLAENSHLRKKINKREEEWRVREEELSLELRNAWGERYHEWITKAERKMQELQDMNQILQDMAGKKVDEMSEKKLSKR